MTLFVYYCSRNYDDIVFNFNAFIKVLVALDINVFEALEGDVVTSFSELKRVIYWHLYGFYCWNLDLDLIQVKIFNLTKFTMK